MQMYNIRIYIAFTTSYTIFRVIIYYNTKVKKLLIKP